MNDLTKIRILAQQDANRCGKPLAILNLNRFSALYVIRTFKEVMRSQPDFVEVIHPNINAETVEQAIEALCREHNKGWGRS